jgi:uncharacterized protein (DUF362 family)
MTISKIEPMASYDFLAIKRFILEVLSEHGRIRALLESADSSTLVVVKPNWIQESHEHKPDLWEPVITHPTVVLAALEALADLMKGRGTLSICDAPHTYAHFEAIIARGALKDRIDRLRHRYPDLRVELIDLRREVWVRKEEVVVERLSNPHDPRGYSRFDLGKASLFYEHRGEGSYYGADYDTNFVNERHRGERHEYLLAGTPIAADLFVNLPKLKTHKKTGITCCLKNLVGINGDKNWLPHHTEGVPRVGGDEFPEASAANRIEHVIKKVGMKTALKVPVLGSWAFRKTRKVGKSMFGDSETTIRNGNWSGNDTCWRMALDLNRALLYGNPDGTWRGAPASKNYIAIVDAIIGGEGNGPVCPDPVKSGLLIAGDNPATVDAVAARLIGFDPQALPIVERAFDDHPHPIAAGSLSAVRIFDGRRGEELALDEVAPAVPGGFKPHFGWTMQPRIA